MYLSSDGAQDTRSQNMGHIEYFKQEQERHSHLFHTHSSSLKQVREGPIPIPRGREHPFLWRQKDTKKNLHEQVLLSFPQVTIIASYSLTSYIPPWRCNPHKRSIRNSGLFHCVFISSWRLLCHVKCILSKSISFLFVNLCFNLIFKPSQGPWEGWGKVFLPFSSECFWSVVLLFQVDMINYLM